MAGDVPVWPDNMALMTVKGGCLHLGIRKSAGIFGAYGASSPFSKTDRIRFPSIKPLKHLCRKMAPAMGSHEALMLSGKGVQTYDQPVND